MSSVIKYPRSVSQTTGGSYRDFSNLNNIKNNAESSYATSNGVIRGKSGSPNRPSTVSCTNFNFSLPVGSEVTSIEVSIRHRKNKVSGATCNIPAPTLSLLGVSGIDSKKAFAPSTSMVTKTYTFKSSKLTRTVVNSSSFGVKVNYPTNTAATEGTLSISFIRIKVNYKVSSYTLSLKKSTGGYNGEDYVIEASISNKNLTDYNPLLTLTAPAGFSFVSGESAANGQITTNNITAVNARTVTWNPKLSSKVGTAVALFRFSTNVTYPTGVTTYTGTFTLVESLNSTTSNHTAVITERPVTDEETESGEILPDGGTASVNEQTVINVIAGNDFILDLTPSTIDGDAGMGGQLLFYGLTVNDISYDGIYSQSYPLPSGHDMIYTFTPSSGTITIDGNWNITKPTKCLVEYSASGAGVQSFYVNVIPEESDLTTPYYSLIEITDEELNRLGNGYSYIVQSDMKFTTSDDYQRDWYKNNRIAVFNNAIAENITVTETTDQETGEVTETITDSTDYDNLTAAEIWDNAEYWSDSTAGLNAYESVECEFIYNKNYPLYIIISGDFEEIINMGYDIGTVNFTEPCIVEKAVYNGRLVNGNYPVSIVDLINLNESDDSATLTLAEYEESTSVVLYDFPLGENYGTNEDYAIRGVQIRANIESTDNLIVFAKLKSPTGSIGQRSIVLEDEDTVVDSSNELIIGGLGDLWGFNTLDMVNLEDWELEIGITNLLNTSDSTINFSDFKVIFYVENIERQEYAAKVEGEELAYYGAVIQDIDIPEGLQTDTDYMNVDGTDINDAYRQNIRKKTITLEFRIDTCDIVTSTDMLTQITRLLVNEKDQYNRPIPKVIEFNHRPNSIFEYIIEDAFDVENQMTGYDVKVKLSIPSGTSYSKNNTVTNSMGYVQGIASINPIITLRPSDTNIQVKETISNQIFNMGYAGDWNNKVVEIDCEDRRVYLKSDEDSDDRVDISKYVDMNSDWFRLHGEFNFDGINCTIRTVTFNERW